MKHRNAQILPALFPGQNLHDLLLITDENDFAAILLRSPNRAEDDLLRRVIPAHGIHRNLHERSFLLMHSLYINTLSLFLR